MVAGYEVTTSSTLRWLHSLARVMDKLYYELCHMLLRMLLFASIRMATHTLLIGAGAMAYISRVLSRGANFRYSWIQKFQYYLSPCTFLTSAWFVYELQCQVASCPGALVSHNSRATGGKSLVLDVEQKVLEGL